MYELHTELGGLDEGALLHSCAVGYSGNRGDPMLEENAIIQHRLAWELHLSVVPRRFQVILEKWLHVCQRTSRELLERAENKTEVLARAF